MKDAGSARASSPILALLNISGFTLGLLLVLLIILASLFTCACVTSIWPLLLHYHLYICTIFALAFTSTAASLYIAFPFLESTLTSFIIAAFFLWHGPHGFLLLQERLGNISSDHTFPIGKHNLVVLNIQLIKHCLVLNPANYDKGGRAARLMGEVVGPLGILGALDERDHMPSYHVLNPHTKRIDRLQAFEDLVLEETEHMLKRWKKTMAHMNVQLLEVDLYVSLNEVFFKVLYRFMFGILLSKDKFLHVHHLISRLERYSAVVGFVPARLLPLYKRLRKDVPSLIEALDRVVDDILEQGGASSPLRDLQDPSAGVQHAQVRDTVKNLLFAGATTAANSLGWAVHCVSREAKWAERARQAGTAEEVNFFKMVTMEANRIYPQANVVTRRAMNEETVEGYGLIPKGKVLVIPIIALHHLPVFFPQPSTFNPDRWDTALKRAPPLMSYIPFTAGPRQCIGQSLFNRAGPPLLMRLFASFSFTPLCVNAQPKWPNAVLPPKAGGFKMTIKPL